MLTQRKKRDKGAVRPASQQNTLRLRNTLLQQPVARDQQIFDLPTPGMAINTLLKSQSKLDWIAITLDWTLRDQAKARGARIVDDQVGKTLLDPDLAERGEPLTLSMSQLWPLVKLQNGREGTIALRQAQPSLQGLFISRAESDRAPTVA